MIFWLVLKLEISHRIMISCRILVSLRGFLWRTSFCMVKYLNFYKSSTPCFWCSLEDGLWASAHICVLMDGSVDINWHSEKHLELRRRFENVGRGQGWRPSAWIFWRNTLSSQAVKFRREIESLPRIESTYILVGKGKLVHCLLGESMSVDWRDMVGSRGSEWVSEGVSTASCSLVIV